VGYIINDYMKENNCTYLGFPYGYKKGDSDVFMLYLCQQFFSAMLGKLCRMPIIVYISDDTDGHFLKLSDSILFE